MLGNSNNWKVCDKCSDYAFLYSGYMKYFDIMEEIRNTNTLIINAENDIFSTSKEKRKIEKEIKKLFQKYEWRDSSEKKYEAILMNKWRCNYVLFSTSANLLFVLHLIAHEALDFVDSDYEEKEFSYYHENMETSKLRVIKSITVSKGEKYDECYNELNAIKQLGYISYDEKCPRCGNKLDGHFSGFDFNDYEEKVEIEAYDKKLVSQADVITYLEHLVAVENNIKFYYRLYSEKVTKRNEYKLIVRNDRISIMLDKIKAHKQTEINIKAFDKKINEANELINNKRGLARKFGVSCPADLPYPTEPKIQKPVMPIMLKAGLFNKSKVEYENEARKKDYERELDKYNSEWAEYNRMLQTYNQNEKDKVAFEEQYPRLLAKQQEEIRNLCAEKEEFVLYNSQDMQRSEKDDSNLLEQQASWKLVEFCHNEVIELEDILKKLIRCRKQLYSFDILFPKYTKYTSIVTILEYFKTGRCSELAGADGAYNLYENELKQDIIIEKLQDIVERLDDIKEGQYLLYTSLENINNSIGTLNETFQKAVDSLEDIEQITTSVKENTAITAYYSAKTAEYTKRNAELTNALGYLVAFK